MLVMSPVVSQMWWMRWMKWPCCACNSNLILCSLRIWHRWTIKLSSGWGGKRAMLICWWYTHALPHAVGVAWAGVFIKDRCFRLSLGDILQKIIPESAHFFFFSFFYHVLVCVPPSLEPLSPQEECEHVSLSTQPGSVAPQKGERVDIRCQGPTAEISMATQEYGCIFQSSPFQLHCLHGGRVRCTQTHFSCHIIWHQSW